MKTKKELFQIAQGNNLPVLNLLKFDGVSSYTVPSGAIRFKSYSDAKKFADEYGLLVSLARSKRGNFSICENVINWLERPANIFFIHENFYPGVFEIEEYGEGYKIVDKFDLKSPKEIFAISCGQYVESYFYNYNYEYFYCVELPD